MGWDGGRPSLRRDEIGGQGDRTGVVDRAATAARASPAEIYRLCDIRRCGLSSLPYYPPALRLA
jgi:hypothetical protein